AKSNGGAAGVLATMVMRPRREHNDIAQLDNFRMNTIINFCHMNLRYSIPNFEIFSETALRNLSANEPNPKSEYRNPKQTQKNKAPTGKIQNTRIQSPLVWNFYLFSSFEILSNFVFIASKFFLL